MIFYTDRFFNTLAIVNPTRDEDYEGGLVKDEMNGSIATGTSIYKATIRKGDPDVQKINVGNFVFVPDFRGELQVFEVMDLDESHDYKTIVAEDAGLDLLNEEVGPINLKGYLHDFVAITIGDDSGWEIGLNEIGESRNLTLEYTSHETTTKRLLQIAGRFGAEVSYSFEFDGNEITHKYINFHKECGADNGVRLEFGKEIKDINKTVSITELATAIRPIGQPHKETIKVPKEITETVTEKVPTQVTQTKSAASNANSKPDKLVKLVNWFESRVGKTTYSMARRNGPKSFDCSSSVHFAAKHAGLIPNNASIGSTKTMHSWIGKYVKQISRSEAGYGDLFLSGRAKRATGTYGHTGVFLDNNTILHSLKTSRYNGISKTPAKNYMGKPPTIYLRWLNPGGSTNTLKYWTHSDVTRHDLGYSLPGITAAQINNWVKAKSPKSPFNGQGKVFIEAQKQSGLDARYILAHAALESAWGTSKYGRKYHNYFGIGAFDHNPDNAKNYSNPGLANGIIEGANWISRNYYNSKYKQKTLYKMRHNGGVHQYATDPKWHTKIANIMKGSERFVKPSSVKTVMKEVQKKVSKTVYEEQEIDVDTNLKNFQYDDGQFYVTEDGLLCDRESGREWSRHHNDKDGYIVRTYNSQATSQQTLFNEAKRHLENINHPKVTYDVPVNYIPEDVDIGDYVRIIDHDYDPPLYLSARLVDLTWSSTDPDESTGKFSNFVEQEPGVWSELISLQNQVDRIRYNWEVQPYTMTIESSNGNIFKDGIISTQLTAQVDRSGVTQTSSVDHFEWTRVSEYPDKTTTTDDEWNNQHSENKTNYIDLTTADVDLEATFTCSAIIEGVAVAVATYHIKDITIGIFKHKEEPNRDVLNWGDVWKWEDDEEQFSRIWKGDRWEDTVTKRDLDQLELTPGPPGQDGEDGLPGKDGKDGRTSYAHFAYADSEDGSIGFTRTATNGKSYIGFYTDFNEADSTNPSDYEWSRFRGEDGQDGEDGIPGKAGADGRTPYFHMAWANNESGTIGFSTTVSSNKLYIGTYTDFTQADSTDPSKYNWLKVKGEQGVQGPKGEQGAKGEDGVGVEKVEVLYAQTSSATVKPTTGWSSIAPTYIADQTIWVRFKITYTNGSVEYTTPNAEGLNGAIKELNEMIGDIEFNALNIQDQLNDQNTQLSNIQVLLEQYPSAESLEDLTGRFADAEAYITHLANARESEAEVLEERFKIIEANVGSGQAFMQAINSYLSYGEEGLLLGKDESALKVNITNERISFLDSGKEVAYISGQTLYILSGVFLDHLQIGNHKIEKLAGSNEITVITPIGGA